MSARLGRRTLLAGLAHVHPRSCGCPCCTCGRRAGACHDHRSDVRRWRGCDPARDRGGTETEREPSTSIGHAGGSGEPRPARAPTGGGGVRPARRGVITVIYDKRKVGYSLLRRDYGLLADDAVAAVALLATQRDVDPSRLGLWAQSEGAYVAPLACRRSSAVKFVITVGAVGVTPAVQTSWGYDQFLRHAGVGGGLPHTLEITALRTMISAGLFPEANYDPTPAWQQVRQPVLAEWGEFDRVALPRESSTAIEEALSRGGNTHYTMRFISGVRHNLNLTADGGFDRITSLPADYGRTSTGSTTSHAPSRRDSAPHHRDTAAGAGSAERRRGLCARRPDFDPDDWVRVLPRLLAWWAKSADAPGLGFGGLEVGRHPTSDRCCRLVHHARPPGLPAVLDDHGGECHRARGRGRHSRGFCSRGQSPLSASAQS